MQLKYNAAVPASSSAVEYYTRLFDAEVIKDGRNNGHAYIKLFGKISFHIHSIRTIGPNASYLIIRFDKDEEDIFLKAAERIRDAVDAEVTRDMKVMMWGTTLFEFKDKYNFRWVLEIDS